MTKQEVTELKEAMNIIKGLPDDIRVGVIGYSSIPAILEDHTADEIIDNVWAYIHKGIITNKYAMKIYREHMAKLRKAV